MDSIKHGRTQINTAELNKHNRTQGAFNLIRIDPHADFSRWPQIYLPTSQNYVHEQNYEWFLYSRSQWFGFNESAHVMVKRKTLATNLSKRLGLAKTIWFSFY